MMDHRSINFKSQDFLKRFYNFLWKDCMKRYKHGGEAKAMCYVIPCTWVSNLSSTAYQFGLWFFAFKLHY